jgi:hypothetical protein
VAWCCYLVVVEGSVAVFGSGLIDLKDVAAGAYELDQRILDALRCQAGE